MPDGARPEGGRGSGTCRGLDFSLTAQVEVRPYVAPAFCTANSFQFLLALLCFACIVATHSLFQLSKDLESREQSGEEDNVGSIYHPRCDR